MSDRLLRKTEATRSLERLPLRNVPHRAIAYPHDADITVFDPAKVKNRPPYQADQTSVGIRYRIVNGIAVISGGPLTCETGNC